MYIDMLARNYSPKNAAGGRYVFYWPGRVTSSPINQPVPCHVKQVSVFYCIIVVPRVYTVVYALSASSNCKQFLWLVEPEFYAMLEMDDAGDGERAI